MLTMTGRLVLGSRYLHIRAFKSEMNSKFEKMRLCMNAEMTTTLIHCLPMNLKWVKEQELPGAEKHKHCKILHLRIPIPPRNECLMDVLRR
jgi:hypothetical protein